MKSFPYVIETGGRPYYLFRLVSVVGIGLMVVALPYALETFRLGQVSGALTFVVALIGLNLLSGFGGQVSLGHAAFFGLGAYTTGVATLKYDVSPPVSFAIGMVLCFVVGILIGIPALRLRGMYLALVTLAVGVLFPSVVRRLDDLTGGSRGIFGIGFDPPQGISYFSGRAGQIVWLYYVSVACVLFAAFVAYGVVRSQIGRAIVALRDNETAAAVAGISRAYVRAVLFGLSGALAGLAGSLFAVQNDVITPDSFTLLLTVNLLVGMVIGGASSLWGPLIGGFLLYFVPYWSSGLTGGPVAGLLFAVVVIAIVFALPEGLAGGIGRIARQLVVIRPAQPPSARRSSRVFSSPGGSEKGEPEIAAPTA